MFLVDLVGVEDAVANDLPIVACFLVLAIEATVIAFVTSAANLIDADQDSVFIAIGKDGFNQGKVAAGFALKSKASAAAAEGVDLAGLDGFFECFLIHPKQDQNLAGFVVLNDGRDQAGGVPFEAVNLSVHNFRLSGTGAGLSNQKRKTTAKTPRKK